MRIPLASVTHLLASLVVPASPEPQRGLWQGAQQGPGVGSVCLLGQDMSWRPDRGTLPLPGQRVPSPRCPSTDVSPNTQPRRDSRSPEPLLGAVWGVCLSLCVHGDVCRVREAGCEGAGRGTASRSWLPLRLALLAAVPKLPSLPLRCLLCCSPKAPGPGDLSRLPQLGFGSSNFRHFTVLLSRCSAEEQCLCREASLAFPHCCWLCLCLAPSCCRLRGDSA